VPVPGPLALSMLVIVGITIFNVRRTGRRLRRPEEEGNPPRRRMVPAALARRLNRPSPQDRIDRETVADTVGRLAALTHAGVAPARAWQVLAAGERPGARVARVTSDMLASGGSTTNGLRLAADSWPPGQSAPGALDALGWLALATDVIDRSGAPSVAVYDGLATGLLAELAGLDEQEVALAGARTTATILAALPLVGAGLGFLMGANVVGVLLATPIGHVCLVLGLAAWVAGRRWTRRLVASAASTAE
jgi:tight adherence protein B